MPTVTQPKSMPPQAPIQQASDLAILLMSDGIPFLALGLAFAFAGVAIAVRRGPRLTVVIFMWISPLPGIVTMCAIYSAFTQLIEMDTISPAPKPSAFGSLTYYAVSAGVLGMFGTVASMSAALAALARSSTRRTDSSVA